MEQRLIDANAYAAEMKTRQDALKELMDDACALDNWEMYYGLSREFSVFIEAKLTLDAMPTVDAVPVVRCMECKYMRESVDGLFKSGYFCERCHITSDMENCDDFYCADGERRTDEQ